MRTYNIVIGRISLHGRCRGRRSTALGHCMFVVHETMQHGVLRKGTRFCKLEGSVWRNIFRGFWYFFARLQSYFVNGSVVPLPLGRLRILLVLQQFLWIFCTTYNKISQKKQRYNYMRFRYRSRTYKYIYLITYGFLNKQPM